MQEVFDVFLTDPVLIDNDVYTLWLNGHNENNALQIRLQAQKTENSELSEENNKLLLWRDTVDQYRLFEMIEHYLVRPRLLRTQLLFQIPLKAQKLIVEQYVP